MKDVILHVQIDFMLHILEKKEKKKFIVCFAH